MLIERRSGQIDVWFVVFDKSVPNPWWNWLIPGNFKHVWCFGYCEPARTWVFVDPGYMRLQHCIVPDHLANDMIAAAMSADAVLRMKAGARTIPNLRMISCCTATVRDILGMHGWWFWDMVPDKLYRDCLDAGGVCVASEAAPTETPRRRSVLWGFLDGRWWKQQQQ